MLRCNWVGNDPLYIHYHDNEWGTPEKDSRKLFELLCLESQQAGLAWITVLRKRENYRQAFYQFDPDKIAKMTEHDLDLLMLNCGLIRHRTKLAAIIKNAQAYLAMQTAGEDFSQFVWAFVANQPQINHVQATAPAKTEASIAMSKALKKKGFSFVGATTCYAFMQAAGLVDDHHNDCPCKTKDIAKK
ncbi:DNA-3-methyladenine glycosylase I [Bibersteinia trehalosi]|uniref:DNA-3-methyladenine glycosylase I n=1 Tax=Bibersteinia trehalosi TaxID=47735 RepID=UPI003D2D7EFD